MAIDLKAATPDTTFPSGGVLFGADSQSAANPSVYSDTAYLNYILSLANTWTATQTIDPADNTSALAVSGYSLTGSNAQSLVDLAGTWNTTGTPTAIKLNVTDTASNAASLLMDLQTNTGGAPTSRFRVTRIGSVTCRDLVTGDGAFAVSAANGQAILYNNGVLGWTSGGSVAVGSTSDLFLTRRGAANLRLGAADAATAVAQTLSVQSVAAGQTNVAGANFTITGSQGTGTGAGGSIIFQVAPAGSSGTAQNALSAAYTISTSGTQIVHTFTGNLNISSGASIGNGANLFAIGSGNVYAANAALTLGTATVPFTSLFVNTQVAWSSGGTVDVILARDAANTLALRNGTNAQAFRVYNTYTASDNFERGNIFWDSNVLKIGTSKGASGGTARALEFQTDGTTAVTLTTGQKAEFAQTIKTAAPAGGTAAEWKLGVAATVSPTSPNRTIEVDIGGTIYYIHAKTTND